MLDLDTFCRYCIHLSSHKINNNCYTEYNSELKINETISKVDYYNWCNIDNAICPKYVQDCPILKNIKLPQLCIDCLNISDCISTIEFRGLQGLADCEFSGIEKG